VHKTEQQTPQIVKKISPSTAKTQECSDNYYQGVYTFSYEASKLIQDLYYLYKS